MCVCVCARARARGVLPVLTEDVGIELGSALVRTCLNLFVLVRLMDNSENGSCDKARPCKEQKSGLWSVETQGVRHYGFMAMRGRGQSYNLQCRSGGIRLPSGMHSALLYNPSLIF